MSKQSWVRKMFSRPVTSPIRKTPCRVRLAVETLEDCTVPSTFTVLNVNDSGAGSLRDAVAQANAKPGPDTINFDTVGVFATSQTITLTSGVITFAVDPTLTTVTGTGASLLTV